MPRSEPTLPRVAIVCTQLAPYHIDRCEAAARRLHGRAEIVVVEIASASSTYAWNAAGQVGGATKRTLFPGEDYDRLPWRRRLARLAPALADCAVVLLGVSYATLDIVLLASWLALRGKRPVLMTESKFDDSPRRIQKEAVKALGLLPYAASIVGAARQGEYLRFLGRGGRPMVTGYDTVDLDRVLRIGGGVAAPDGLPFAQRDFVFVGRFVPKKNLRVLVDAYARYRILAGQVARRLVLVGSGPLEPELRRQVAELGLDGHVVVSGFLQADGVARALANALALVLPSIEEQWGLVVNEALAFNLPVIVSECVGSRDALVRNLVNGFVIHPKATDSLALAMHALSHDEAMWRRMVEESRRIAPLAHADRFGEAVESILEHLLFGQSPAKRAPGNKEPS